MEEKGVNKFWTPEQESHSQRYIDSAPNFATKHLLLTIRDLLKYDQRSKEGKRAKAQARLRLAIASDKDLEEMAKLRVTLQGEAHAGTVAQVFAQLVADRHRVRKEGFKKSELEIIS